MDKLIPKPKKIRGASREELSKLDKKELIDTIIQLEAHNTQLKNIIKNKASNTNSDANIVTRKRPFDFSKCHYRRILLHLMYFGWDYQGLAVQEDSTETIEHHLFNALTKSCLIESREKSQYHRCGRTDKGVSAFGQVLSLTVRSKNPLEQQSTSNEMAYCKVLNRLLPREIRAVSWMPLPMDSEISARFDCKKRQYKYYFPRSNLDIPSMRQACTYLVGSKDFRNLCKMDVAGGVTEFVRRVLSADVLAVDASDRDQPTSMYYLLIEGNAFLWHQIRCIMAVLLLIGEGKEKPEVISELLDVENNPSHPKIAILLQKEVVGAQFLDTTRVILFSLYAASGFFCILRSPYTVPDFKHFCRKPQYNMALDIPLNLFNCSYGLEETNEWIYDEEELACVIRQLQCDWTLHSVKTTMIKDCLQYLEKEHRNLQMSRTEEMISDESERDIAAYTDCLVQGVKPKIYTPLLKRLTCSSLEEKVEHYRKRRKVES